MQKGPIDIPLAGQAVLHLPAGYEFVPAGQADRLMVALGNTANAHRLGLVASLDKSAHWIGDLLWVNEGHVPDGDAKEWKPDAMLENIRQGTDAQNKERLQRGIPALDISGWVEPPTYDAAAHRLVWSLLANIRGAPAGTPQNVNYNTYALGREGFISLDIITNSNAIAQDKVTAHTLLSDIQFDKGRAYSDFNPSTDHLAAYGLAALVGAVAIKKLGLLAVIGVFLLKAWKIGLVLALGGWAAVKRFFGKIFGRRTADAFPGDSTPD